jgi:hypothetical protein
MKEFRISGRNRTSVVRGKWLKTHNHSTLDPFVVKKKSKWSKERREFNRNPYMSIKSILYFRNDGV